MIGFHVLTECAVPRRSWYLGGGSEDSVWHQCLGRDLQTTTPPSVQSHPGDGGGGGVGGQHRLPADRECVVGEHSHRDYVSNPRLGTWEEAVYGVRSNSVRRMNPGDPMFVWGTCSCRERHYLCLVQCSGNGMSLSHYVQALLSGHLIACILFSWRIWIVPSSQEPINLLWSAVAYFCVCILQGLR